MEFDELRSYCLSKKASSESFPFGEDTLVFKVAGKMFALVDVVEAFSVNLKCNPEKALELRAQFPEDIRPGYHMNKKHWNTVVLRSRLSNNEIKELIDHSYNLVVKSLTKKAKESYNL
ncbi:MAG: MmcQ/YjbR family DNA-binding protein [Bacteroidia bacterium]